MLARVGVRVKVNSLANPRYFAKGQGLDTSMYLLGWGGSNTDAIFTLQPLLAAARPRATATTTMGATRIAKLDELTGEDQDQRSTAPERLNQDP